jgi:hypothetical protein
MKTSASHYVGADAGGVCSSSCTTTRRTRRCATFASSLTMAPPLPVTCAILIVVSVDELHFSRSVWRGFYPMHGRNVMVMQIPLRHTFQGPSLAPSTHFQFAAIVPRIGTGTRRFTTVANTRLPLSRCRLWPGRMVGQFTSLDRTLVFVLT